jgi:DNA-binding MarR family transcriptional regulator
MLLVLVHLVEVGSGESREIAETLKINPKYVSVLLGRCKRRGFVEREPYKRGRERGFVYRLSEKGAEWLLHKASVKKPELPVPPEPQTKVILKPVLIGLQPPEPSFSEKILEFAKECAFIDNLNPRRQQTEFLASLFLLKQRHREERARARENGLLLWLLNKENRQNEYGKFVAQMLQGNQKMIEMLFRYSIKEKSTSLYYSKSRRSSITLKTATEPSVSIKRISRPLRERSASQEVTKLIWRQLFNIRAAYLSHMDRWWDTLEVFSRVF